MQLNNEDQGTMSDIMQHEASLVSRNAKTGETVEKWFFLQPPRIPFRDNVLNNLRQFPTMYQAHISDQSHLMKTIQYFC